MKKVLAAVIGAVVVFALVSCDLINPINPPAPQIMVFATPDPGDESPGDMAHGNIIKFGSTPVNVHVDKTFTIKNVGDVALTIDSISTDNHDDTFSIYSGYAGETTLNPDQEHVIVVRLLSAVADNYESRLVIPSDDPDHDNFYLNLEGEVTN